MTPAHRLPIPTLIAALIHIALAQTPPAPPCPPTDPLAAPAPAALASTLRPEQERLDLFAEAWRLVNDNHLFELLPEFGGEDWQALRDEYEPRIRAAGSDLEFYELLQEMFVRFDTFGLTYAPVWVLEAEAAEDTAEQLGIGVTLTPSAAETEADSLRIVTVFPDGPAARAGLRPRDRILAIDGATCPSLLRLAGPEGGVVTLTVRSPGEEPRDVELVRTPYLTPEPAPIVRRDPDDPALGYLWIPSFTGDMAERVAGALAGLLDEAPLDGLVIDLRHNTGRGPTRVGTEIARQFTVGEVYGYYRHGRDYEPVQLSPGRLHERLRSVPVVAVVDRNTMAIAEAVALALRDRGGAWLLGEHTPGNTYLYSEYDLDDGSRLFILTHGLKTLERVTFEAVGLTPDIAVEGDWTLHPEAEDPYLLRAAEFLRQLNGALAPGPEGQAPAALIAALGHEDWRVRAAAVRDLGALGAGARDAISALQALQSDEAERDDVRRLAEEALALIADRLESGLAPALPDGVSAPYAWLVVPAGGDPAHPLAERNDGTIEPVKLPPGRYDLYWIESYDHRGAPLLLAADVAVGDGAVTTLPLDTGLRLAAAAWVPARDASYGLWGATRANAHPDELLNWTNGADALLLPPGEYDVYWVQGYEQRDRPLLLASDVRLPPGQFVTLDARSGVRLTAAAWVPARDASYGLWGATRANAHPDELLNWTNGADALLLPPGEYDVYWVQGYEQRDRPLLLAAGVAVVAGEPTEVAAASGIALEVPADTAPLDPSYGWWGVVATGRFPDERIHWSPGRFDLPLLLAPGSYDIYWKQAYEGEPERLARGVRVNENELVRVPVEP